MNIDFHYYGTFVASRLAGYNHEEAEKIAYAAQYVDDSGLNRIKDKNNDFFISDMTQIPTIQNFSTLIKAEISRLGEVAGISIPGIPKWTEELYNETLRVWPNFHFLPGNYDKNRIKYKKTEIEHEGIFSVWKLDKESKRQFRLMCHPNSSLVKEMIENLRKNYSDNLEYIGLCMHVMADTWAHMYYAGIPAWFINSAREFEPSVDGATPIGDFSPFYNSYNYLGHSFAGHTPDYPSKKYEFKPRWSDEKIKKDNTEDFLKSFCQMIYAMKCIRNNEEFEIGKYQKLSDNNELLILKNIFEIDEEDQSKYWKNNIIKIEGLENNEGIKEKLEIPEDYDESKWLNEYDDNSQTKEEFSYYKFNKAAADHLKFVKSNLAKKDLYLDDIPQGHILSFYIKNDKNEYISVSNEIGSKYFPTLGNDKIKLEFILPKDKKGYLLSGTTVKIRNNEYHREKRYLGAWKVNNSIYYYIKDWDIFKQKWRIIQENLNDDEIIDFNKPVIIINEHFKNKPYLAPNKNSQLTTRKEKYEWYLESN